MSQPTRRVVRRPRKLPFRQRYQQFLVNKNMAEAAISRNEGDKKAGVPGLKSELLEEVKTLGERDPESGSFFLELDEPIELPEFGVTYTGVKAERRAGTKNLNVDRAREWLEEHQLLDEVEEFQYILRLPRELADSFAEWLKESGMVERLVSCDAVFIEDNLLALHHRKDPVNPRQRVLPEADLDSFYDVADDTWAFVTIKKK